ncbi:MAG: toxin [Candidatus Omnitrophica bacterium]|nr:toxin [Candidatus Omnitrophota bacterium]
MLIEWNSLKSERLKRTRGVSFEEILSSKLIAIRDHPKRGNQKILIFKHKNQYWVVPFISEGQKVFLKTLYPSRKFRKIYEKEEKDEKS